MFGCQKYGTIVLRDDKRKITFRLNLDIENFMQILISLRNNHGINNHLSYNIILFIYI